IFVGDNQFLIIEQYIAESLALRACAYRVIKGKQYWSRFGKGNSAIVAGIVRRKSQYFFARRLVFVQHDNFDFFPALFPCRFYRIRKPGLSSYNKPVQNNFSW